MLHAHGKPINDSNGNKISFKAPLHHLSQFGYASRQIPKRTDNRMGAWSKPGCMIGKTCSVSRAMNHKALNTSKKTSPRLMRSETSQPVERAVVIAVAALMRQPIPVELAVVITVAALMRQPIPVERAMVIFAAALMRQPVEWTVG